MTRARSSSTDPAPVVLNGALQRVAGELDGGAEDGPLLRFTLKHGVVTLAVRGEADAPQAGGARAHARGSAEHRERGGGTVKPFLKMRPGRRAWKRATALLSRRADCRCAASPSSSPAR